MSRLKELRQRKADLWRQYNALVGELESSGQSITAADDLKLRKIEGEIGMTQQALAEAETQNEAERAMQPVYDPREDRNDPANAARREGGPPERRAAVSARYADCFPRMPMSTCGFRSFGELSVALARREFHPGFAEANHLAAMNESVGSEGGMAVPTTFRADLMDGALQQEVVRPRATLVPNPTGSLEWPGWDSYADGDAGLTATWEAELEDLEERKGKLFMLSFKAKKLVVLTEISNELLNDAQAFGEQLKTKLERSIARALDRAFLHGNGMGKPAGILSSANPALIVTPKESGQAAGTVTYQNLADMFGRLSPASIGRAEWLLHPTLIPNLLTLIIPTGETSGQHVPVLTQDGTGRMTLLTRPVIISEFARPRGSQGDISLIDFSMYDVAPTGDLRLDVSNAPGFLRDSSHFRAVLRVDGAGSWKAPLTPDGGGDTLSWAVTLAERA